VIYETLTKHTISITKSSLFSYLNHSLTVQGNTLSFFTREPCYKIIVILLIISFAAKHIYTVDSTGTMEQSII